MCSNSEDTSRNPNLTEFEKRLLYLSENNINCDCEFIVGCEKIIVKGHKLLFSAASEVFQAMFYGGLREENAVSVQDLDPEGFKGMTFFIYTGKVNFTSALNALSIFTAARKYLISGLREECIKYIKDELQPSEVLEFYENCKVHHISDFEDLCGEIIRGKTDEVVESDFFSLAKMDTIEFLLASPSLNFRSEIEVFVCFEKWVIAEVDRKGISVEDKATHFNSLKKHVRFLTLRSEDFVSQVADSSILTDGEKMSIACNLLQPGSQPIPETLSSQHQYRKFTNYLIVDSLRRPTIQQHTCTITVPIGNLTTSSGDLLHTLPYVLYPNITFKISHSYIKKTGCCYFLFEPLTSIVSQDEIIWPVTISSKLRIVAEEMKDDLFLVNKSFLIVDWRNKRHKDIVIAKIRKHELTKKCFVRGTRDVIIEGFFEITAS